MNNFFCITTMKTQSHFRLLCHFTSAFTRIRQSIFFLFRLNNAALVHSILISRQEPHIKPNHYIAMLLSIIFPKNKFVFILQQIYINTIAVLAVVHYCKSEIHVLMDVLRMGNWLSR